MTILFKYFSKRLIYPLTMKTLLVLFIYYTFSIHGSIQHAALGQPMKDSSLAKEVYFRTDSGYNKCLAICLYCYRDQKSFYDCANVQCPLLQDADFPPHFDEDCVLLSSLSMKLKESLIH
ncbi:hypothetical protein MS3_00004318 [Schistosoma haematobium]|uniref:Uncharacterized protein n=2 Tax=Schistosoma TaxID=6181 RepID=A0A094ZIT1_SCHHA|nr:hypothetical protein MS3_00004318 [Schistosoma haematobium]CAH8665250.1 unnamed protein product [Schistosoma margrebowiei]CAH8666140.1 unnamed protein product [Schistosoma curassoni]KAH9592364.1 hypothetical protein MS3_00004318 [Schistosoma haematobium]CAH8677038.1 unnamed protein product [Schistosoma haematobium]CAH8680228.1 unnamed protein product [Schistosoma haematobium]